MADPTSPYFFKERREELDMTQRDVALKLDMTTSAVSCWDRAVSAPETRLVPRLAVVYRASEAQVLQACLAIAKRLNAVEAAAAAD